MVVVEARGNDTAGYLTYFNLMAGDAVGTEARFGGLNLTGYDVKMTIGLPTPLELTVANGGIVIVDEYAPATPTEEAGGVIRIVIPSDVTVDWKPCEFPFDLWLIKAGSAHNYLRGFFVVTRGQTVVP